MRNYGRLISAMASLMVVMLTMMMCYGAEVASAQLSNAQCHEERRIGLNACKAVLVGRPPSAACCQRVRVTHVQCVCQVITPKLAAYIDLKRAIPLIQGCGRRVPRHFKCGSITTP
ncbi:hypothetical protein F8388_011360 [Cannabis sativa]|uniref:Bifunctional inhibitor/plant lipid transfer protein/seed storage helical domain-containing protein n=1 Tax=Cannabis sativa TaxID=3483 RepID=A0A7J6EVS0_CANSA|nr:hypothetical protein F8388_011360 [Cannabis sativa]